MKIMVRIPMATSIKKVEKPVVPMTRSFAGSWVGFSRWSVFFFWKKCVSIMRSEKTEPMAAVMPAPMMPMSNVNTKKWSPNTLNTPPSSTDLVASAGAPSLRRNTDISCVNRKLGTTNLMGNRYSRASGSRVSSAPKSVRNCRSKKMTATQVRAARMTVPMTAAEKYSLDFFSLPAAWPRMVLKRILPPMPVSRPRL